MSFCAVLYGSGLVFSPNLGLLALFNALSQAYHSSPPFLLSSLHRCFHHSQSIVPMPFQSHMRYCYCVAFTHLFLSFLLCYFYQYRQQNLLSILVYVCNKTFKFLMAVCLPKIRSRYHSILYLCRI
jgi:hypothetical protein